MFRAFWSSRRKNTKFLRLWFTQRYLYKDVHNTPLYTTCLYREETTKSVLNYDPISPISTLNSLVILSSLHHILLIKPSYPLHSCTKLRKSITDLRPSHRGQTFSSYNSEQNCYSSSMNLMDLKHSRLSFIHKGYLPKIAAFSSPKYGSKKNAFIRVANVI